MARPPVRPSGTCFALSFRLKPLSLAMNAVASPNLIGITGIARRLVMDGALDEAAARNAMARATEAKVPLAQWIAEKKLVGAAQMAAANAVEFGMPVLDTSAFDPAQNALKLVSEELLQKHHVLPLFKRGNKLFVGTSQPTQTAALAEIQFHTNLVVEPILVDEDQVRRTLEQWQNAAGSQMGGSWVTTMRDWTALTSAAPTRMPVATPASTPRATTPRW